MDSSIKIFLDLNEYFNQNSKKGVYTATEVPIK